MQEVEVWTACSFDVAIHMFAVPAGGATRPLSAPYAPGRWRFVGKRAIC